MDKRSLIKNLMIAFIPLLIFVVADEFCSRTYGEAKGTQYALLIAIAIGVIQALYVFITEKRLDTMLLFDTGLIIIMGGISLVSGNDIFFKLKPACVEFIMVIILGVMAFLRPQLLQRMTGRYMPGVELSPLHLKTMQRSMMGMFAIFLLHTLLIVYAAFFMSKAAWAFISGGLFYILMGLYLLVSFVLGRLKRRKTA